MIKEIGIVLVFAVAFIAISAAVSIPLNALASWVYKPRCVAAGYTDYMPGGHYCYTKVNGKVVARGVTPYPGE